MAPTLNARIPLRNRAAGLTRPKPNGDENATSKHVRQSSTAGVGPSRTTIGKSVRERPVLNEVTKTAVNRKESAAAKAVGKDGKEKESTETSLKRSRSSSLAAALGPQRVPLGPGRVAPAQTTHTRVSSVRVQKAQVTRATRREAPAVHNPSPVQDEEDVEQSMDIEDASADEEDPSMVIGADQVEAMIDAHEDDDEDEDNEVEARSKSSVWPQVSPQRAERYKREVEAIRAVFEDEQDMFDTTMVSEYAEEIFVYMNELEESIMPNPDYMDGQNDITWEMRQTLVDWLLQVHLRYHMLPETLWIAINIIDRFLTKRVVSMAKLQLVGITAIFIASKYEEILAPGVEEFVYMTENGYTREEILKGERIILQTLEFKVSQYCSPYSWMRKISKADDYDIQTRTLSKFLTEVTLLDHRFLRAKPSVIAAVGMYTARRMLGGDWNDSFVFYSGYTEEQMIPGHQMLVEKLNEAGFDKQYVFKKYANKKFLKAAVFALDWARTHIDDEGTTEQMMLEN